MSKSKHEDRHEDIRSVKFTDYAINKYQANFDNVKGKSVGIKLENSGLKGLKLIQYKKTGKKYFHQNFWFDGNTNSWTVGEFRLDIFGIKECQTKVVEIMKTHTDDNGLWIKSPRLQLNSRNKGLPKLNLRIEK